MTLYSIYVSSNKDDAATLNDINECANTAGINGLTVIPCRGIWQGIEEGSYKVEVICEGTYQDNLAISNMVTSLLVTFNQDCIYVTSTALNNAELISRKEGR